MLKHLRRFLKRCYYWYRQPQLSRKTRSAYVAAQDEWDELLAQYFDEQNVANRSSVLYYGSQRLAVAHDGTKLYFDYLARGYRAEDLMLFDIMPDPPTPLEDELE